MMAELYRTGTEYTANEIKFTRGSASDIVSVGVFHSTDPSIVPTAEEFTTVHLIEPGDVLAEGNKIDVLALIGPRSGADLTLEPGDYQRWVLIKTNAEDIIRKIDTLTVL